MSRTYTTKILHLQGAPEYQNQQNVITKVEFETTVVAGEYTHKANAHIQLNYEAEGFIQFDQLTEQVVIDWVEGHPAFENTKNQLDEIIENIMCPMDAGLEKPW